MRKPKPIQSERELASALGWPRSTLRDRLRSSSWPVGTAPPWSADAVDKLRTWQTQRKQAKVRRADAGSRAIERYRDARAQMAELELQELRGRLVHVETLHDLFVRLGELMRSAGEDLQREYGPAAADMLNEVLDDWDRELEALEQGGKSKNPAPSRAKKRVRAARP